MPARRTLMLAAGAVSLAGCSPIRALNALVPSRTYTFTGDVAYGLEAAQRFDVYEPTGARAAGGDPMVVFFYGGSWTSGRRADYRFVGEALASRGMVAVVADYRLYPDVSYPDFLRDSAQAVNQARRQAPRYGANPRRLFLMGHSAGAYNAAMLALDARWLRADGDDPAALAGWIGLAGPYDFVPIVNPDVKPVFHAPNVPPDSQPIVYADRRSIPCMLGAATKDSDVDPQRNTAQLAARLQRAGNEVTLHWYPRTNHQTLAGALARPLRFLAPVLDDVCDFVKPAPRVA